MATMLQGSGTIFGRSDVWKMETETMPFGKELEMAMPQEILDGHGTTSGGTSEEGLTMEGSHKAIRRQEIGGS